MRKLMLFIVAYITYYLANWFPGTGFGFINWKANKELEALQDLQKKQEQ